MNLCCQLLKSIKKMFISILKFPFLVSLTSGSKAPVNMTLFLLSNTIRIHRRMSTNDICPICNNAIEDHFHAFRDSSLVKNVWIWMLTVSIVRFFWTQLDGVVVDESNLLCYCYGYSLTSELWCSVWPIYFSPNFHVWNKNISSFNEDVLQHCL